MKTANIAFVATIVGAVGALAPPTPFFGLNQETTRKYYGILAIVGLSLLILTPKTA